jgi:Hydrogenase 4 membrane component (E)
MSDTLYVQLLDLAAGLVLVCAFVALWRRGLVAIVRALAVQGVALAAVALLLGLHQRDLETIVVAALVLCLKGVVIPKVLLRIVSSSGESREVEPLVNVPASLLGAAGLVLLAYATTRNVVALDPSPETRAIPIGMAVALIGFFALATRRKAVTQIVGFLLLDNGIALIAFLGTSGVPLVVELGVALDVLLAVLILQVLVARMRSKFGAMDLDQLRELHD